MPLRSTDILTQTPQGLYCPLGDFHIDPIRPVPRALITHGHSDHARSGHRTVLATRETLLIMGVRYGEDFAGSRQEARLGEAMRIGDVTVRFTPAGHVLGSAQIAIEAGGTRLVVSGDYKRAEDPTCRPYEVVPCDVFITEATFGLPVFRHPDTRGEVRKLLASVALFPERAHIVGAYALGKAQRVMALLREEGYEPPIYLHGAMEKLTEFYKSEGIPLGETPKVVATERGKLAGAIVLCPPSAMQDLWSRRFPDPVTCFASGWMRVRARARQKGVELPLVISDHSDWDDLCRTILDTGAGEVWVTHGQEDALVHWCLSRGIRARPLHMLGYGDEGEVEPTGTGAEGDRASPGNHDQAAHVGAETPHSNSPPQGGRGPVGASSRRGASRRNAAPPSPLVGEGRVGGDTSTEPAWSDLGQTGDRGADTPLSHAPPQGGRGPDSVPHEPSASPAGGKKSAGSRRDRSAMPEGQADPASTGKQRGRTQSAAAEKEPAAGAARVPPSPASSPAEGEEE